jgi:ketosteroid isomerase-like protein
MSAVSTQREADEAQIRQQVARIAAGIRAKDLEGLRPVYATDVVSFDVEPPLQHVGVEAKLKNWANVFAVFRDADYEVRGLDVAVGDDVAFGHCFGRLHGTLMNAAGEWPTSNPDCCEQQEWLLSQRLRRIAATPATRPDGDQRQ